MTDIVRVFIAHSRREAPLYRGGELALLPRDYYGYNRQIRCEHTLVFDMLHAETMRVAGEIALRAGDSAELYYLGHIGYHVDPPYRGHGYAAQACRLLAPALAALGMRTAVITTDPDNTPSIKTCLRLGCELECTVPVPEKVKDKVEISDVKHRFIWTPGWAETDARGA